MEPTVSSTHRPGPAIRAQSETVGAVLVLALVVILVSAVGAAGLVAIDTFAPAEPAASVGVDGVVDDGNLTLVVIHEGGDPLEPEDVLLIVDGPGDRERVTLTEATGSDATFRAGDRLTVIHPTFDPDDRVHVIATHGPTGAELADVTVVRPTPS